jgi:hypothetical protein
MARDRQILLDLVAFKPLCEMHGAQVAYRGTGQGFLNRVDALRCGANEQIARSRSVTARTSCALCRSQAPGCHFVFPVCR